MNRFATLALLSLSVLGLTACHKHLEMQYTPEQYAKLRGVEIITTPPTREYELVAVVEGFGGPFTAKETMINTMIDAANKAGARAVIPMEFAGEGQRAAEAGQAKPVTGLDLFVVIEKNRTITKGRAIRWLSN
jgi:hypothetical protein